MSTIYQKLKTRTFSSSFVFYQNKSYTRELMILTGNLAGSISSAKKDDNGFIVLKQDATGDRTVTINDQVIAVNPDPNSYTGITWYNIDGSTILFFLQFTEVVSGATALNAPTWAADSGLSSSGVTLNWNDTNTSPNESSFHIDIATDSGFASIVQSFDPAANATSQVVTGLSAETTYYKRIRAVGNGSTTSNSAYTTGSFTTDAAGPVYITWRNKANVEDDLATPYIKKNAGVNNTSDAFATSVQKLEIGESVELIFNTNGASQQFYFGITTGTVAGPSDLAHAIYLHNNGTKYLWNGTSLTDNGGAWADGSVIKVTRTATEFQYRIDGVNYNDGANITGDVYVGIIFNNLNGQATETEKL